MSDEPKGKPRGRKGGRYKADPTGAYRRSRSIPVTDAEYEAVKYFLDSLRKQPQNSEWTEN